MNFRVSDVSFTLMLRSCFAGCEIYGLALKISSILLLINHIIIFSEVPTLDIRYRPFQVNQFAKVLRIQLFDKIIKPHHVWQFISTAFAPSWYSMPSRVHEHSASLIHFPLWDTVLFWGQKQPSIHLTGGKIVLSHFPPHFAGWTGPHAL